LLLPYTTIFRSDAHVAGGPHQVARLGLGRRDNLTGAALGAGAARQVDTDLGEDVLGEPGAVEGRRSGAAQHVRGADVAEGDVDDLGADPGGVRGGAGGLGLGGCFGALGFGALGLGTLTGAGRSALIAARSLSGGALVVGLRLGL